MNNQIKYYQYYIEERPGLYSLIRKCWNDKLKMYVHDQILAHIWESSDQARDAINQLKTRFESFNPDVKS